MGNALVKAEPAGPSEWLPAMTIEQAVGRYRQMVEFVSKALVDGTDYGKIPGTGDKAKPTLLKPGAEKLCTFFGLRKVPELLSKEEDWTGERHGGEPFFYYVYRYNLYRGDVLIAAADGSCNSWEKKYRWRHGDRVCPLCQKPTIFRSKPEKGGGWFCWSSKGGCGAQFRADDPSIADQKVGRVPNADPADVVNTIQKMAQKRALIAATLLACNASDYFTQDLLDEEDHGEVVEGEPVRQQPAPPPPSKPATTPGVRLRDYLGKRDDLMARDGLAKKGELLSHVIAAGVAKGYSDDVTGWTDEDGQCFFGVEESKRYEAAKRKQAKNGTHDKDEPSERDQDGVRLENWLRAQGRALHAEGCCENESSLLDYIREEGMSSSLPRDITHWKGVDIKTAVELAKKWMAKQRQPVAV